MFDQNQNDLLFSKCASKLHYDFISAATAACHVVKLSMVLRLWQKHVVLNSSGLVKAIR